MVDSTNFYLVEKLHSINHYQTRNWNRESATRYIFSIDGCILEASFFIHFADDQYVKSVVELPVSFGCPIGCKHCASALLKPVRQLSAQDMWQMIVFILNDQEIASNDKFLLTYSGIGEGAFRRDIIKEVSERTYHHYPKSHFTLTTVGFDPSFVYFCEELAKEIPVHYLQISYLHYDIDKLTTIIPKAKALGFNFRHLIHAIHSTKLPVVRLNYVLVKGLNDSVQDWDKFIELLHGLEQKILVRISQLNETEASQKYGLLPVSEEILEVLNKRLQLNGFKSYIFVSEHNDNMNCGQLAWRYS